MALPFTNDWKNIAENFLDKWQFPNRDEKHIHIESHANSESFFFNYKGTFSIVLLAIVDAE